MNIKQTLQAKGPIYIVMALFIITMIVACKPKDKKMDAEKQEEILVTGEYLKKTFETKEGKLNYRIVFPTGFKKGEKYPLFLFLHGAGERGDDNEAQLIHGGEMIRQGMEEHNAIAVFPQCPAEDYWVKLKDVEDRPDGVPNFVPDTDAPPSAALSKVIELMGWFSKKKFVDTSRIYVSGLSMGGMGTFDLCWRMPNTFAAANAICGAGSPQKAKDFVDLPIRIFHGTDDVVVSVDESLEMIEALREAGGAPQSFIYEGVNHGSWNNAFAEPDFLSWFFKHEK